MKFSESKENHLDKPPNKVSQLKQPSTNKFKQYSKSAKKEKTTPKTLSKKQSKSDEK